MSDIRAQSRRDAEFDRLLAEERQDWTGYSEGAMRDAYEMGKRHGRESVSDWRPMSDMPPMREWVFAVSRGGSIMLVYRAEQGLFGNQGSTVNPDNFTHWMPLPERPGVAR